MSGTTVDLTAAARAAGGSAALSGYLATPSGPSGDGPWPGIVAIHEIWGLDAETRAHADRLASMGYLTLATDLFSDGGKRRCLVRTMQSLVSGRGPAYADIAASRTWLREQAGCTGKVGVIGFCMGGGFALMTLPDWDVAAPNYGTLPAKLEQRVEGACPVVASYGGRDLTLRGAAAKLEIALAGAGVEHDVKEYPAAGHSFLNEHANAPLLARPLTSVVMHAGPEPGSATDAWHRIAAYFETHLR